jgi:hypothetical protein
MSTEKQFANLRPPIQPGERLNPTGRDTVDEGRWAARRIPRGSAGRRGKLLATHLAAGWQRGRNSRNSISISRNGVTGHVTRR